MDHHDAFGHAVFGLSLREAVYVDPQRRLLLETAYQAVETSGYLSTRKKEAGDNVGVFIGNTGVDYLSNTSSHSPSAYSSIGILDSFLCGRINHHFGWMGPSEALDTTCSSSLVAINRASKAIQQSYTAWGIIVSTSWGRQRHQYYRQLPGSCEGWSTTGQCKPFSNDADSYCRAEGVGLVFLKALDQALRENDQTLGVVCGSASNQGGLSPSITIPHSPTQIALHRKILDQARISPVGDIDIITGHSVLRRPLCPTGMYMECVAMAA